MRQEAIPRLSQARGFVGAQWVRLEGGSGTSVLTFETEEAAQAAVARLTANPPPESAVTIDTVEVAEVVERDR